MNVRRSERRRIFRNILKIKCSVREWILVMLLMDKTFCGRVTSQSSRFKSMCQRGQRFTQYLCPVIQFSVLGKSMLK